MTVVAARKLSEIAEKVGRGLDPRQAVIDAVGQTNIDKFEVFHNLVLVGTYVRSSIKKIITADGTTVDFQMGGDRTRAEDRFQGKIGLVLKVGPMAFQDDAVNKFGGVTVKPGDWVMYRTSDAQEFFFVDEDKPLDGASARLIEDSHIKARVADPALIF